MAEDECVTHCGIGYEGANHMDFRCNESTGSATWNILLNCFSVCDLTQ